MKTENGKQMHRMCENVNPQFVDTHMVYIYGTGTGTFFSRYDLHGFFSTLHEVYAIKRCELS